MSSISLIANTGIQFHKFKIEIDPNAEIISTMGFCEKIKGNEVELQYAYYLPQQNMWVTKKSLVYEKYLDENGNLVENINVNILTQLKPNVDLFFVNDIEACLDKFENKWIPIPYFKMDRVSKKYVLGPIAWARMIFKNISPKGIRTRKKQYHVVIAFDTTLSDNNLAYYAPRAQDASNPNILFGLCNNEDVNLNFCDLRNECSWVANYLKSLDRESEIPYKFPDMMYIGQYLYLIKYFANYEAYYLKKREELLGKLDQTNQNRDDIKNRIREIDELLKENIFPDVYLYTDKQEYVEVDLVLDIGNSNTCGLLFDSPIGDDALNFRDLNVKKLILNDLSEPEKEYSEPFPMHLAFAEAKFGEISVIGHSKCFKWPSILRVGKEAQRLINKFHYDTNTSEETATFHSSPKRYLWDKGESMAQWQFINPSGNAQAEVVYIEGISEQFKRNGDFAYDGNGCTIACYYSNKSLMTFVYIELLLHAYTQINSHKFRINHNEPYKPRKLKRITITCPTAMVLEEQIILRECAKEALLALERYFKGDYRTSVTDDYQTEVKIIPNIEELKRGNALIRYREDWMYDESTCCQLVFLYAELCERYLNNSKLFFDIYGKKRNDIFDSDGLLIETNTLTIASIDIGGGTTDLMICAYEYKPHPRSTIIVPHPLYWDSFTLAGDDLLKKIVQQIIIEGAVTDEKYRGCTGVIENYAISKGLDKKEVRRLLNNFFGKDAPDQTRVQRIYRKSFISQIALPIALSYLKHTLENKEDIEVGFDYFFSEIRPNPELINFFNNHFGRGFSFEEIKWKLSKEKVINIVETTFDLLFRQISKIISAFGCDFVLLAGKLTSLTKIRDMFIKYYPVSPDRIIALNNYRVGRWYPFQDGFGYINDPKTVVAVGALIALLGGKLGKLKGFNLETKNLIEKIKSTANYMGFLDLGRPDYIKEVFFTPEENSCEITITRDLPFIIGFKQLPNYDYFSRPIYKIDFNDEVIREESIVVVFQEEDEIQENMKLTKENYKKRMPWKVKLKRNFRDNKEVITIESIKDKDNYIVSNNVLSLTLMTLPSEKGYWLDTGEFILNIE